MLSLLETVEDSNDRFGVWLKMKDERVLGEERMCCCLSDHCQTKILKENASHHVIAFDLIVQLLWKRSSLLVE